MCIRDRIKRYQDFFVRYEELLYNSTMRDVTWTHCGGDNLEYRFEFPFSVDGEAEKIWLTLRENESYMPSATLSIRVQWILFSRICVVAVALQRS